MYTIKNGVLYKDGKPEIGMGVAYYASFHPHKYPVPPDGDREGEMRKDLHHMAKMKFNLVRTSALGEFRYEDGEVKCSFPFIDKMMEEAQNLDIAALVRLNSYSMNMRNDPKEVLQVNHKGEKMPGIDRTFVTDCVNHPGVIADNRLATEAIASHFAKYDNVVMNLIYNEPAYSYDDFYDYHPESIKAYRKWLVKKGYKTEEEAEKTEPPRRRPNPDEDDTDWVRFRMFSTEAMSNFLCDLGKYADKGNPKAESLTCMMPVMLEEGGVKLGEDLFAMGDGMDIIGVTDYLPYFGQPVYYSMLYADTLASAAKMNGKNVWAVECNAHTSLSAEEWQREIYGLLGSGMKGLIFYQFRADYDNGKGPEIGMFGILDNNANPTLKYPVIMASNEMVYDISETLATSHHLSSDIGILFSHHACARFDARENGWLDPEVAWTAFDNFDPGSFIYQFARYNIYLQNIHRELREKQIVPNIVRASDLEKNTLGLKTLIIPSAVGLSDEELEQINAFAKSGGYVFNYQPSKRTNGYVLSPFSPEVKIHRQAEQKMGHSCTVDDILYITKFVNDVTTDSDKNTLVHDVLENDSEYTVAITNFDTFERAEKNAVVRFAPHMSASTSAIFRTVQRKIEINGEKLDNGETVFRLPEIHTGCFLIVKKSK